MSPGPRLTARFASVEAFLQAYEGQMKAGGLLIPGAQLGPQAAVGPCTVALEVGEREAIELAAQLAASIPNVGVAVLFTDRAAVEAFAAEVQAPAEEVIEEPPPPAGTVGARLRAMSVTEKMQLALSADRETRGWLLRDTNKALHLYVLRNPRIGLDEVSWAAKLSTLAPEALKFIADHKEWGLNPTVCAAIARNPKSPVPLVLRILPRVPAAELRAIAKGTGRAPIVQAARKLVL